jgi:hypothetical protein
MDPWIYHLLGSWELDELSLLYTLYTPLHGHSMGATCQRVTAGSLATRTVHLHHHTTNQRKK